MSFRLALPRRPATILITALAAANLLAWLWALAAFRGSALLGGTALLAYGLGLRHAVDADHIAAIDNVTRKLMLEGKRPTAIGFFFALGHSTVVVAAALVIAATAQTLEARAPRLIEIGGAVGTTVSAGFLFAIAMINLMALIGLWRLRQRVKRGAGYADLELDALLAQRGLLARLCRRLSRLISHSWHMYPLGALFALGFDTASEVGLLGISAAAAVKGLSAWSVLSFAMLFAAGMSLVDTLDGVLMVGAYGWAFPDPLRRLHYNLSVTGLSVCVALGIGGIEVLSLVGGQAGASGVVWRAVDAASSNFGVLGYGIIAAFAAIWLVALVISRMAPRGGAGSA
jgi:nickel/cobalt transporter (NiCoT) family protein